MSAEQRRVAGFGKLENGLPQASNWYLWGPYEGEFLSPFGLRSLSAYHRDHPYELDVEGVRATIDYEPAESTTPMFGGNSNWRGPLWFPLNWLVISALERYHQFFGSELKVEYPTGSGIRLPLDAIAQDLRGRLISIFLIGPDGRRPCFGWVERLQHEPAWKDNLVFNEYFHGDKRRRPWRRTSDRMDRGGGRPDPPPVMTASTTDPREPALVPRSQRAFERWELTEWSPLGSALHRPVAVRGAPRGGEQS